MNKLIETKLRKLIQKEIKLVSEDLEDIEFDFEDYDGTDLSGPYCEIAIDDLISEYTDRVNDVLNHKESRLKREAMRAIKNLWIEKLNQWI